MISSLERHFTQVISETADFLDQMRGKMKAEEAFNSSNLKDIDFLNPEVFRLTWIPILSDKTSLKMNNISLEQQLGKNPRV